MKRKPSLNAQKPKPSDSPCIHTENYIPRDSYGSALRRGQEGTAGFNPMLSGHGKAGKSHTSGFNLGPPDYTLSGCPSLPETAKSESASITTDDTPKQD